MLAATFHLVTSLSQAFEYGLLEIGHTLTQASDAGLKLLYSFIKGYPDFFDLVLNVGQSLGFNLLQGSFQGFLLRSTIPAKQGKKC